MHRTIMRTQIATEVQRHVEAGPTIRELDGASLHRSELTDHIHRLPCLQGWYSLNSVVIAASMHGTILAL